MASPPAKGEEGGMGTSELGLGGAPDLSVVVPVLEGSGSQAWKETPLLALEEL